MSDTESIPDALSSVRAMGDAALRPHRVVVVLAVEEVGHGGHQLIVAVAVDVRDTRRAQDVRVDVHLPAARDGESGPRSQGLCWGAHRGRGIMRCT